MRADRKNLAVRIVACLALLLSCFYMYDFYKCLSGFIANGFREPLVMLPMILAFFLPVLCFLFFFYDFFVRPIGRVVKMAYSMFVIVYAVATLALIFAKISLYVSNSSFGVYDALPSIIVHFPYDMIIVLIMLAELQVVNLTVLDRPDTRAGKFVGGLKQHGTLHIGIAEYIILSVFAIVIFVFVGASLYAAFSALSNAFYDMRYIFLILWVLLIPMGNLVLVTLKPEKMNISRRKSIVILSSGVAANLVFAALFVIFELTSPDFLIHVGKPLFLITFSISRPIEPCIIFGIMALATVVLAFRLVRLITKSHSEEQSAL